ncbi:type VII secretion-associated serine protease mycosin [Streptomyces sp. NPDC060194]|uniref:type VII secretion-associated serine protease mycosin n=1 Tax=Streptomyces sp. NPDC060194 TaxID=3347069 RepID=UPI00365B57C9
MRTVRRHRRPLALLAALGLVLLPTEVLRPAEAHADPIRDRQWSHQALRTADAWRTTEGEGVTVAVLDTGVDDRHPDLAGQVLPGKDLVGFGADRGDRPWARHGTGMAAIIAGRGHGPDRGQGVLGVAPEAKILPVRVILEDSDPARKRARTLRGNALAQGIRWAVDHGADVINLSLGDDSASAHPERGEDAAVQYALSKGVSVVASAGNGGEKGDRVSYPAAYPGVIAVTAVDEFGARASFSTRRWYATVSGPGVDVVLADPDTSYYEGWGTSAAAAFVSGSVALVRAAHPELTPVQVRDLITETARDAPDGGRDDALGHGIVDPAAAIERASAPQPAAGAPAPSPPRYFGDGPRVVRPEPERHWFAPAAGALGAVLVLVGAGLWFGRARPRGH